MELTECRRQLEFLKQEVKKYKFDFLTRLMQRKDFDDQFNKIFEEYLFLDTGFTLVLIDIDNLHAINRQEGYDKGDQVIRQVSDFLKQNFKPYEVYRIGGDEFTLLVRNDSKTFNEIENILSELKGATCICYPAEQTSPGCMFKTADEMLRKVKEKNETRDN